jgi:hypothetical protein
MRIALLVVVALGLGFVLVKQRDVHVLEGRLGEVASEIARRDVRVRCQSAVGATVDVSWEDGSVWFDAAGRPADVTNLKRRVCRSLDEFPRGRDDEGTLRARSLALSFLATQYARMPDAYRSPECRDGGSLDLRPESPVWP